MHVHIGVAVRVAQGQRHVATASHAALIHANSLAGFTFAVGVRLKSCGGKLVRYSIQVLLGLL